MVDDDYTAFCNHAFDLRKAAEKFFAQFSDEQVRQLSGLVREEVGSTPTGKVEPAYDCLVALLAEEVEHRNDPHRNVVRLPRTRSDEVSF